VFSCEVGNSKVNQLELQDFFFKRLNRRDSTVGVLVVVATAMFMCLSVFRASLTLVGN